MGIATDRYSNRFCTIEINPGKREFDCTVKTDKKGSEQPKDVWYYGRWVSLNRVMKFENSNSATYFGYRYDL